MGKKDQNIDEEEICNQGYVQIENIPFLNLWYDGPSQKLVAWLLDLAFSF